MTDTAKRRRRAEPDTPAPPPALPLFYRDPQPLSSERHADWRLKDGHVAFAAEAAYAPIMAAEIASAARTYPIVFAGETAAPIAVLGLEHRNLFVQDSRWAEGAYVPAYVRRHPFGFIATGEPDRFVLAIDVASERVAQGGEDGAALFEAGQPSALTRQALDFCDAFAAEARATEAFSQTLIEAEVLVERRADATLPDGRKLGLTGFRVIDAEKLAALKEAKVVQWHRKGWLALATLHLASLDRFADLLDRQGRATPQLFISDTTPDGPA